MPAPRHGTDLEYSQHLSVIGEMESSGMSQKNSKIGTFTRKCLTTKVVECPYPSRMGSLPSMRRWALCTSRSQLPGTLLPTKLKSLFRATLG